MPELWFLRSALRQMLIDINMKFRDDSLRGFQDRQTDGRTDRQTDRRPGENNVFQP